MIDVSLIITTKNEDRHIENCLKAVRNQIYPHDKIEIIVVDNNSLDQTKKIAYKYTDKIYNFGPERSAQRNYGIEQAQGEYILYLDADMILSQRVIAECVEKCKKERYVALYIPEKITGDGFWIKVRDFERSFYDATAIDCVRFVKKDEFLKIGGFDETLTGPEDWDFDRRIKKNGKVDIIKSPLYHNEGRFNLKKYLYKKSYYSRSLDKYIKKWGKNDPLIRQQLGLWYRYFIVFIESKQKFTKLISHPLLLIAMFFLRIMIGISYLKNKKLNCGIY